MSQDNQVLFEGVTLSQLQTPEELKKSSIMEYENKQNGYKESENQLSSVSVPVSVDTNETEFIKLKSDVVVSASASDSHVSSSQPAPVSISSSSSSSSPSSSNNDSKNKGEFYILKGDVKEQHKSEVIVIKGPLIVGKASKHCSIIEALDNVKPNQNVILPYSAIQILLKEIDLNDEDYEDDGDDVNDDDDSEDSEDDEYEDDGFICDDDESESDEDEDDDGSGSGSGSGSEDESDDEDLNRVDIDDDEQMPIVIKNCYGKRIISRCPRIKVEREISPIRNGNRNRHRRILRKKTKYNN
jgi:hypothetical protein